MVKLKKNNNIQGFFDIEKCLVEGKKRKRSRTLIWLQKWNQV
jgi:hypothetical protein